MKRTIYTILAAILLTATGCEKTADRLIDKIVGEWHYTAQESGITEDVWLSFSTDGTFEMYQKVGEGAHWYAAGEYSIDTDEGTLSGVYSDRYPWKYDYRISFEGNTLVMTAVQLETYSVTYVRESIPDAVRDRSLPLTKAETFVRHL